MIGDGCWVMANQFSHHIRATTEPLPLWLPYLTLKIICQQVLFSNTSSSSDPHIIHKYYLACGCTEWENSLLLHAIIDIAITQFLSVEGKSHSVSTVIHLTHNTEAEIQYAASCRFLMQFRLRFCFKLSNTETESYMMISKETTQHWWHVADTTASEPPHINS